ncbi:hypothetical protein K6Y74_00790 [Burkholderia cenocepacia]|uniref:hypothetical protein n=1 Tax=Burkholderia cenocepacia TaxID=95486 RepID=UPI002230F81A|nr:hypothetical protein [Burkholderia cenocepacia]MCW3641755.1 hypothetical protein [Burkholderia cenocepacia]
MAADVLGPDFLDRLAQVIGVPELMPTPRDLEDQAPHLVTVGIAAPHFAQLSIGRRLEGWEGLAKHVDAKQHCMDIQSIAMEGGFVNSKKWGPHSTWWTGRPAGSRGKTLGTRQKKAC